MTRDRLTTRPACGSDSSSHDRAVPFTASILLVEDEADLREDIAEELQAASYHVVACGDGEEALARLAGRRYDLILCDISMPVMDGYTLLNTLRAQRPDLADIPFVFLTAQAAPAQVSRGKRAGADDYLVKPIDFDLMLATVEARLRQLDRLNHFREGAGRGLQAVQQFDSIQGMLDSLSVGMVTFAADGLISFVNKMALISYGLHAGDSLSRFADAIGIRETGPLRQAVQQMIAVNEEATRCLALTRSGAGAQNVLVTLCALERTETAKQAGKGTAVSSAPAVSVIVSSVPGQRLEPPLELLQELYGLTPAEARIAWAFTQGHRSDEIAAQFQISSTTVAFHKRNIFLKTQTNRQADLIALLLSLPVV